MVRAHDGTLQELRSSRESTENDTIAEIEWNRIRDFVEQTVPSHVPLIPCPPNFRYFAGNALQAYDVVFLNLGEIFGTIGSGVGGADVLFQLSWSGRGFVSALILRFRD